jgi:hypothetical protein
VKFGPKMENGPRPARAELSPCARPRSGPKPKTARGPLFLRPRSPVPSRHAARDGNQPTDPIALSVSRAPGRNLGLGWESLFPPGLNLGPVIVSRPSQSDGCVRFPAEQNRLRRPHANPSLISLLRSLSRVAASDSERRRRERARGAALSPSPVCTLTVG